MRASSQVVLRTSSPEIRDQRTFSFNLSLRFVGRCWIRFQFSVLNTFISWNLLIGASDNNPVLEGVVMEKGDKGINGNGSSRARILSSVLTKAPTQFLLSLTGRVETAEMYGINDIYCKYNLAFGPDWQITAGMEEGISQITKKNLDGKFIWNFPIEVTFKSTNPHGWPQLVLSVYGSDFLGNHVARGYGSTHIPLSHGSFTKMIPLFVPESSSFLQKISSWLVGRRPEFIDPKIVAQSDGRQTVRVKSLGHVTVKFEVVVKDFSKMGYVTSSKIFGDTEMSY